jgi:DNA replication protein DnaC
MTIHISARVAWHDSGWNGRICQNPKANTYCIGQYSFPGTTIAEKRDLSWEESNAGLPCHQLDGMPPCIYSINAFGENSLQAISEAPDWFRDGTSPRQWQVPPYTVCTWPYEAMYSDDVLNQAKNGPKYDPVKRRAKAKEFFEQIEPDQSLVFYYANYSNPFCGSEEHFYVVVGVSRVKRVGPEITWLDQSAEMGERYGPNVWMRNITSHYPDQGLRLPYHHYMDHPDILERILFVPENSRHFKYATRHISDDGALGLIERFSEIVGFLQEQGDTSENWPVRQEWLGSVMAELWQNRGVYPGILRVWDYLKFHEAVKYTMDQCTRRSDQDVKDELFAFVEGRTSEVAGLPIDPKRMKDIQKRWRYLEVDQQNLLRQVLPRFDLQTRQISQIIENPDNASIYAGHATLVENPYILCEQYVGLDPDDQITFSQIDHGIFPSPELGEAYDRDPDDWTRLRALAVEQLQRANQHTFLPAEQVLHHLNHKLGFLPEWKRAQFTQRMVEVEKEGLSEALSYRYNDDQLYLYRRPVFEDERLVESVLRDMANRSAIQLKFPVKEGNWKTYLKRPDSEIARSHPAEYETAIEQQLAVCQQIFQRPISVLCGAAGTGKTTVVTAIIKAIEKAHGTGTSFQLLAPTGKAADRLRERTGKDARTLHSFLAQRGWLNDNLTFRREGGQREEGFTTYIIDEASMLDLGNPKILSNQ